MATYRLTLKRRPPQERDGEHYYIDELAWLVMPADWRVGQAFEVTSPQIANALHRFPEPIVVRWWPAGEPDVIREMSALADTYSVTPIGATVKARRAKAGPTTLEERDTTTARVAEMWRLHDEGLSDKEIARVMEVHVRTVQRYRGRFPRGN